MNKSMLLFVCLSLVQNMYSSSGNESAIKMQCAYDIQDKASKDCSKSLTLHPLIQPSLIRSSNDYSRRKDARDDSEDDSSEFDKFINRLSGCDDSSASDTDSIKVGYDLQEPDDLDKFLSLCCLSPRSTSSSNNTVAPEYISTSSRLESGSTNTINWNGSDESSSPRTPIIAWNNTNQKNTSAVILPNISSQSFISLLNGKRNLADSESDKQIEHSFVVHKKDRKKFICPSKPVISSRKSIAFGAVALQHNKMVEDSCHHPVSALPAKKMKIDMNDDKTVGRSLLPGQNDIA